MWSNGHDYGTAVERSARLFLQAVKEKGERGYLQPTDEDAPDFLPADAELIVSLAQISLWQRFLELLFPARRRQREARLYAAIEFLVGNPKEPVMIDGERI